MAARDLWSIITLLQGWSPRTRVNPRLTCLMCYILQPDWSLLLLVNIQGSLHCKLGSLFNFLWYMKQIYNFLSVSNTHLLQNKGEVGNMNCVYPMLFFLSILSKPVTHLLSSLMLCSCLLVKLDMIILPPDISGQCTQEGDPQPGGICEYEVSGCSWIGALQGLAVSILATEAP